LEVTAGLRDGIISNKVRVWAIRQKYVRNLTSLPIKTTNAPVFLAAG
jgi:hypothetical protein